MGKYTTGSSYGAAAGGGGGTGLLESGGTYANSGGTIAASSLGTTLTSSGTANTKGSYVEIIASTSGNAQGIILNLTKPSGGNTAYMVDISLGAVSSEVVLISNIALLPDTDTEPTATVFLPCTIPSGSRVSARVQSSATSQTIQCSLQLLEGNTATSPTTDTLNADTSTSWVNSLDAASVSANTKTAYSEIIASTAEAYTGLVIGFINRNTSISDISMLIDVATGAAASETDLLSNLCMSVDTNTDFETHFLGPIPVSLDAGTRLSYRIQSSRQDAACAVGLQLFGIR